MPPLTRGVTGVTLTGSSRRRGVPWGSSRPTARSACPSCRSCAATRSPRPGWRCAHSGWPASVRGTGSGCTASSTRRPGWTVGRRWPPGWSPRRRGCGRTRSSPTSTPPRPTGCTCPPRRTGSRA
ncbi:hypothetical protein [Ornithinimicrobium kibberense]|uniref:hypothetical protein n=1 Tax=Ornithinimicrobium kibberense TaxID=282060 RepID=UPI0036165674